MDCVKLKRQFEAAVQVIQNLPKDGSFKPSHELMLKFYAYYKQATQGQCRAVKPSFWDVVGKAKWEAWSKLGSMSSEEAMQGYVNELKQIIETMPQTDEVNGLLTELDNFYTLVDLKTGEPIANGDSPSHTTSSHTDNYQSPTEPAAENTETSPLNTDVTSASDTSASYDKLNMSDVYTTDSAQSNHRSTDAASSSLTGDVSPQTHINNHNTGGVVNGLDLIGHSSSPPAVMAADMRNEQHGSAPDLIHQPANVSTLSALHHHEASSIDSDTDSEVYLDSSEVVPTDSPRMEDIESYEKTVDLLESCSKPSVVAAGQSSPVTTEPAGAASSDYIDHSSHLLNGSSTRTKMPKSKQHSVPESTDLSAHHMSDVNEKLRMALLNMQQEMKSLDKRLALVEQITVNQRKRQIDQENLLMRWWPFPGLSPRSALFIFVWPVFVVWFMRYLSARRRRP